APSLISALRDRRGHPRDRRTLAAPTLPHQQVLFTHQSLDALVIHHVALARQGPREPRAAPAHLHRGELAQARQQGQRWLAARAVAHGRTVQAQVAAGLPLRQRTLRAGIRDDRAPLRGRHHSFPKASLRTWMLRAWSATTRLSRRFSSSSVCSRWSSGRSTPPYFRFQRYSVSSEIPWRRITSFAVTLPVCSCRIAMISSAEWRRRRGAIRSSGLPAGRDLTILAGPHPGGNVNFLCGSAGVN